jgi:hypothetical protein
MVTAAGVVQLVTGFDPRLGDFFLNAFDAEGNPFQGPPNPELSEIRDVAKTEFGVELPQSVLDGVLKDASDFMSGATDTGRRMFEYDPGGRLINEHRW